ncbi:hypothetical protein [Buttiauxella sp. B2]|uniref:hypothetical protein n=1 Tax=Buttiauxella sp. B2 TaxID=2587812 RepID=UPI001676B471|nr:hypothetical protein [Buttiauxella sp. B2]
MMELKKAIAEREAWGANPHTRRMEHYGKTCWAVVRLEQELDRLTTPDKLNDEKQ